MINVLKLCYGESGTPLIWSVYLEFEEIRVVVRVPLDKLVKVINEDYGFG